MRIVYFAAVREAMGRDGEEREFPSAVLTVADALDHLAALDSRYAAAFADRAKLRFALDREMVKTDAALAEAGELAIFPPVTGG